jgi:zinc protease
MIANNRALTLAAVVGLLACGGHNATIPATPIAVAPVPSKPVIIPSTPLMADVPPPGEPKPLKPASITQSTVKDVKVVAIASPAIPVVHCRIMVRAGNAAAAVTAPLDKRAGLANLVAELLHEGGAGRFAPRELADRIDALGSDLSVEVGPDRVIFGLAVTKDKLDAAMEVLGAVVSKPRFDAGEFKKLKARELDRVRQSQKGSGSWIARAALYNELFGKEDAYGFVDATVESLEAITMADVRAFYQAHYATQNTTVIVAGDIDNDALNKAVTKYVVLPTSKIPNGITATKQENNPPRVIFAKRASAKQADILVGAKSISRTDPRWPELALAVHALGGGMASRLFVDVREKRSLAYSTSASMRELALGPSVVALYAGTQTALAPKSVTALLEHLEWVSKAKPIDESELSIAKTSLETGFLFRLETIGAVGGLVADQLTFGLPGKDVYEYVATYRAALRSATMERVRGIAGETLSLNNIVIAVAGDPALAQSLRRFGKVRVVDPEKAFATVETLTGDPNASLEVPIAK